MAMKEELEALSKNYKIESELLKSEQGNRKLQLWIQEEKKIQTH